MTRKLGDRPEIQAKLRELIDTANDEREKHSISSIRALISNDNIREAMTDLLELSPMPEAQKQYVKAVLIDRLPKKTAIQKAFGRDLGYQEEAITTGLLESKEIKQFVETIKQFYIQVSPIAAMKEVEVLMTTTDDELKLKAADQISRKAGIGLDPSKLQQLPVNVTINIPTQTNIAIEK